MTLRAVQGQAAPSGLRELPRPPARGSLSTAHPSNLLWPAMAWLACPQWMECRPHWPGHHRAPPSVSPCGSRFLHGPPWHPGSPSPQTPLSCARGPHLASRSQQGRGPGWSLPGPSQCRTPTSPATLTPHTETECSQLVSRAAPLCRYPAMESHLPGHWGWQGVWWPSDRAQPAVPCAAAACGPATTPSGPGGHWLS